MTRRLGGIGRSSLAAVASLSLATALACSAAMVGCSSDTTGTAPTPDSGPDGTVLDGSTEGSAEGSLADSSDGGQAKETGTNDAPSDVAPLAPCAIPVFAPAGGAVSAGSSVTITSANLPAGGFIFYTTDMTLPTHSSPALESGKSLTITQAETIRAIASASTCSDSAIATAAFTLTAVPIPDAASDAPPPLQPCPAPTIAPNGGPIGAGQNATIASTVPGATIFYTTNGTNPTHGSPVYSAPLQVNQNETIRAITSAATCTDSAVAIAALVVQLPDGGLPLPVFTPPSETQNNDFQLALSVATSGTLVCYTLDGVTVPTCSTTATTATCTGTSVAYNAATRIAINGSVTDPATGKVTVQAIACGVGYTTTTVASQTYTLQVSQPTMVNPLPGNTVYSHNATPAPVWPAPTLTTGTAGASIQYTTNGMTPTCGVASPGVSTGSPSAPFTLTSNTTFNAIGCKAGYAPSLPNTLAYTIQLNAPVLPSNAAAIYYQNPGITPDDTANGGAADWICSTTDGSTPGCGATANSCLSAGADAGAPTAVTLTADNITVKSVACKVGLTPSTVATAGPYLLQLSAPTITPPGFNATTGQPTTSYQIPVAGFPGAVTVGQSQPVTTPATPVVAYGFTCVMNNGTPSCGVNACSAGTQVAVGAALPAVPVAGDHWSVIGCPSVSGPSAIYSPSAVTTVVFATPNGALAPSITPAAPGPYTSALAPQIANTDPTAVEICYTTDGSAPTCANNACTHGTSFAADGAGAATLAFTVTAGGSGYSSALPPVVTISGGGGTCTTPGATVVAGAVTAITVGTCTGYTSAPTVTISGGGGTGATATALPSDTVVLAPIQTDNTQVQAVACSSTLTSTAGSSRTYNFRFAEPDLTLVQTTMVTGDQNGGGSLGSGQQVQISTTSNFGGTINYVLGGATATCATGTSVASGTNITIVAPSPFAISAIACGSGQQPSPARAASFTVGTAPVVIAPGTEIAQNAVAPTLSSVTGGAIICYTTDGSTPGCSAGACTGATTAAIANGGTVPSIGATGTTLKAVACTGTLAASAVPSATYTLNISNVVVNIATQAANACPSPSSFTLGLDQSAVATDAGGPTQNATVCYTTDGTTPPPNCAPLVPVAPATYVCFSTGAGGTTPSAVIPLTSTTPVSVVTCKAGFNAAAVVPVSVPIAAYSHTITVDGNVAEWSAGAEGLSNGTTTVGYFTHDATNLYFGVSGGYTPTASPETDVTIYVGDATSTATGPWVGPAAFGSPSLPFAPAYMFSWNTAGGSAPVALTYPGWAPAGFTPSVGFQSGATAEFAVPIGTLKSVNVLGAVVSGAHGTTPVNVENWPQTGGSNYLSDVLNSCQAPNANLH